MGLNIYLMDVAKLRYYHPPPLLCSHYSVLSDSSSLSILSFTCASSIVPGFLLYRLGVLSFWKIASRESGCRTGYEPTNRIRKCGNFFQELRLLLSVDIQGHQRGGFHTAPLLDSDLVASIDSPCRGGPVVTNCHGLKPVTLDIMSLEPRTRLT